MIFYNFISIKDETSSFLGIFELMKIPEAKERFAPQKASKLNHQRTAGLVRLVT